MFSAYAALSAGDTKNACGYAASNFGGISMLPERKGFPMKRANRIPLWTAALGCALLMTGCGGTHPAQNAEHSRTEPTARTTVTHTAETTARTSHAPAETTARGVTTDNRSRGTTTTASDIIDHAESKVRDAASDVQSAVTSVLTEATREVHPFDHE